jgi:hypothetical protein
MDPTLAEMETELYESPPRPSAQTLLRVLEYCTQIEETHHLPYPFYYNMVMVALEIGQGRLTDRVRTFCRDWEDLIAELDKIDVVSRSEIDHHGAPRSSR